MKIRLLQIKYKNIREFADLIIDLTENEKTNYPISLIQMPNGLGKTTTMTLLRYALNGTAESLDEKRVMDFRCNNNNYGEFELKLSIDEEIYYIILSFDFIKGKVKYFTSRATSGHGGGRDKGNLLPPEIRSLFTENFVKLFVFDGELTAAILDIGKNEAENAIKSLYSLDKILSLLDRTEDIVFRKQQYAESKVSTDQGFKQLKTKLENAKTELNGLFDKKNKIKEDIKKAAEDFKKSDDRITNLATSNNTLLNDINDCERKIKEYEKDRERNTERIIEYSREPVNINKLLKSRLENLGKDMTKLKLPRSTASEFFVELLEDENSECICGRVLLEEHKNTIIHKMKDYLTEDQIGVINKIKSSLKSNEDNEDIGKLIENAKDISQKYFTEKTHHSQFLLKIKGTSEGKPISDLLKERDDFKTTLDNLQLVFKTLTTTNPEEIKEFELNWVDNIKLCQDRVNELNNKYNESLGIINFSKKAKLLEDLISEICEKSLNKLKEEIKTKTNIKVKKILNRDDIFISEISSSIKIHNRSGVSEGQKLSIAYSFLSSMFEGTMYDLPFLVDSPAGSLDLEVRREVSQLIPPMFKQFIVFITSGEKYGFADYFYSHKDVGFLTLWKEHKGSKIVNINKDIEFFKKFQSEDDKRER